MGKLISKILLTSLIALLLSGVSFAQDFLDPVPGDSLDRPGLTEWDHGIVFWKSTDGEFEGRFDTRMFLNGAYFFENLNELSNGTHLRKARLALKFRLWRNWITEWDIDVAEGIVEIKDMYFAYATLENSWYVKFGHFKVPFGLEILTTSRFIVFPERAYNALAFKLGRRMGLEYSKWGNIWNVRATVFGQTFDATKNKTYDETGTGVAARFAIIPIQQPNLTLHLGVSDAYTTPDDDNNIVDFNSEPETKIGDVEMLDTGPIRDVSSTNRLGFEGALVFHNFHLQGEYNLVNVTRMNDLQSVKFYGGYVYLTWTITGEHRYWNPVQGEFNQLIPFDNLAGAWEVALRFSHLSLSDTDALILGGRANNYTVGLNWYPNMNMAMQVNYTYVENSPNTTGDGMIGGDKFSYLQFMAKVFF